MNVHVLSPGEVATTDTPNPIIPRATIRQLCERRDDALARYEKAWDALTVASDAIDHARAQAAIGRENSYNYTSKGEKAEFHYHIKVPERADYMKTARRLVDTDFWAHIVEFTELEQIMDKKAKDELRQSLLADPPEFDEGNVFATLQRFVAESGMIFKRGMALCFSSLDKRFRSHDGWKVGHRIVRTYMFDKNGWWNYGRSEEDTLIDIERCFRILDENPANYCEIIHKLRETRRFGQGPHQSVVETQYFTVRAYKNGNAHIWFKRDDLVEKVNKLLGEYYGAPIPEERDTKDDGGLFAAKITPAKNFGFFPTPDAAADTLISNAGLHRLDGEKLTVLEPSAGTGNLARRCAEKGHIVDCVELQPQLATGLRNSRRYRRVLNVDFLALKPEADRLYDRVVMNPPFDLERDIDHVVHALKFLKPEGLLVAIMSAGTEFRETRKSTAFRELIASMRGDYHDLPPGSFAEVGTYCNTLILRVFKDRRQTYWN